MPARARERLAYVIQRPDRVVILAPFDAEFVDSLRRIPYRWRHWDGDLRSWTVREPHVEEAVTLALAHFALEFLRPTG